MLKSSILLIFIFFNHAYAESFKVLSFNTLCDLCAKKKFDEFDKRKVSIKSILDSSRADLISLQEVRSSDHLNYFFKDKRNFKLIFWDSFLFSYPDPTLAINTERFDILKQGQFWLGPNNGAFSIGWKYALPRQVQWVKLKDKRTDTIFHFLGSHFDNRVENMLGSAQMIQNFINSVKGPIIFAADTNCTEDFEGYKKLIGKNLINSFDQVEQQNHDDREVCYLRKGKKFPACRVDHILLSKESPWKVLDWKINTYKSNDLKNYPSDHRPVEATFSY